MTKARSAIIIGGGHNGLICAAYLARKGLKVEVLDARNTLGGGLALTSSHMSLHASILKDLKIKLTSQAPVKTSAHGPDGEHLCFSGNTVDGPEAASYAAFREEYLAYAKALGLAFQVQDDILDVTGDAAATGKAVGKAEAAGKATFVSLLGLDAAKARAAELVDEACAALAPYGDDAASLKEAARFVIQRSS